MVIDQMIMTYDQYTWPSQYDGPMEHQKQTFRFLLRNKRAFDLSTMGTGKTLSALWACDFLMINKKIRKVLVVCPLSTMQAVWGSEIFRHLPHRKYTLLHGSKEQRLQRLKLDVDFYIINHDGIKVIENALKRKFDIIIIDEATAYKTWKAQRTKCMKRITDTARAVWSLTGSPTANSPLDAFGIAKVTNADNPNLIPYFTKFRDDIMMQLDMYTYIPRLGWEQKVAKALSPAIRHVLEDCIDLPEVVHEFRELKMTAEQSKVYKEMRKELVAEYNEGLITASNAGVKALKLLQISAGSVYDENKIIHELDNRHKLNELLDIFYAINKTKLIIFCQFKGSLIQVAKFLNKHEITNEIISGDVSAKNRAVRFDDFQRGDLQTLVMQPSASAHGLNLTASNTIVWFSPVPSNEVYQQANARVRRPGQTRGQLIIHLYNSTAEKKVYKALTEKQSMSQTLLSLFQ